MDSNTDYAVKERPSRRDSSLLFASRTPFKREELEKMTKDALIDRFTEVEAYIEDLQQKLTNGSIVAYRELEQRLQQQQTEATRRENYFVVRLTQKEQELQDSLNQIQELKAAAVVDSDHLKAQLLDPAVNLLLQTLQKQFDETKEKLEQCQNDLTACKFTPDSQTGKRLMGRCRMLLQENEELAKATSSGRIAQLETEISLKQTLVEELKRTQTESEDLLVEADEIAGGLQETVYTMQHQVEQLRSENEQLRRALEPLGGAPTVVASNGDAACAPASHKPSLSPEPARATALSRRNAPVATPVAAADARPPPKRRRASSSHSDDSAHSDVRRVANGDAEPDGIVLSPDDADLMSPLTHDADAAWTSRSAPAPDKPQRAGGDSAAALSNGQFYERDAAASGSRRPDKLQNSHKERTGRSERSEADSQSRRAAGSSNRDERSGRDGAPRRTGQHDERHASGRRDAGRAGGDSRKAGDVRPLAAPMER